MCKPARLQLKTFGDPAIKKLIAAARRGDHRAAQRLANRGICPRCLTDETHYSWAMHSNFTRHIRVSCARCGRHLRWARRTSMNIRRADEETDA